MTQIFGQIPIDSPTHNGAQSLLNQQVPSGEHEEFLPSPTEKPTQYILDGKLHRDRSVERTISRKFTEIETQAENNMPRSLETHSSFGPQVEFGPLEY